MGAVGGTELIQRVKAGRRFYEQIGGKKKGQKSVEPGMLAKRDAARIRMSKIRPHVYTFTPG